MAQESGVQLDSLIMQIQAPAEDVKIEVAEAIVRKAGITEYVGYLIKVSSPESLTCERRYRQFAALREVMCMRWPGVMIPVLPPKYIGGSNSLKVVQERKKYLTYFLNCVAKHKYLYQSEEMQYFLRSADSDLRNHYQNSSKISYNQMLERYQACFKSLQFDEEKRNDFLLKSKAIIDPFSKQLLEAKVYIVNLKNQTEKLAVRRDQYVASLRVLYNQSLPKLQSYIKSTGEECQFVFTEGEVKEKAAGLKYENGINFYWLIFQALKLEIEQLQATYDTIQKIKEVQRDEQRIKNKINSNNQDLSGIKANKFSLKNLFNRNSQQLTIKLERDNEYLNKELLAVNKLVFYVNALATTVVIDAYKAKRMSIWKDVWKRFLSKQIQFNQLAIQFYNLFN